MQVRLAIVSDLMDVNSIYEEARKFMAENGNPHQWGDAAYPPLPMLINDIGESQLYVIEEDWDIKGVFALVAGDDPTYQVIEEGTWRSDAEYATLHRVAAAPGEKGIFKAAVEFAKTQYDYLRVDTHYDNIPMQKAIEKCGFVKCGRIYVEDGSPRIAYDLI